MDMINSAATMPMGDKISLGGSILQGVGSMTAGWGARREGKAAKAAAEFQATQLRQGAGQAIAASQRASEEERRKARLFASRALAVAAASGGGASDPTVVDIIADLKGEGAYRAMLALYGGEERARTMELAADAKVYEGELAQRAGRDKQFAYSLAGMGSLAKGAGSLFAKYAGKTPAAGGLTPEQQDASYMYGDDV